MYVIVKMNAYMRSMNGMNVNAKEFVPAGKVSKKCVKEYVVKTIFKKHCEERREFNKEIIEKYNYKEYID
jgi:hypothetical protein